MTSHFSLNEDKNRTKKITKINFFTIYNKTILPQLGANIGRFQTYDEINGQFNIFLV